MNPIGFCAPNPNPPVLTPGNMSSNMGVSGYEGVVSTHGSPVCSSFSFIILHTSTLEPLDKPWSQVSSLVPPVLSPSILSRIGFSNPTARRFFIECC